MDPVYILPEELWRMIFEKLEDPGDWLNLYRASQTFEEMVGDGELRTRVLVAEVFPLVRKYLVVKVNENINGLLPLRLVSRHWKKAIDATLGPPPEIPFGNENVNFEHSQIGKKYNFFCPTTISSFLEKFAIHPGNPFVGNFVQIWFTPDCTEEMTMERGRLMHRFGIQITRLTVKWFGVLKPSLDISLDQFRSCVQLAPNLDTLTVRFLGRASDYIDYRFDNPILGNQPAPVIPKLKSFTFTEWGGNPGFMMDLQNRLVRLCCNPDTLKTAEVVGLPMELTTFPNLETASMVVTRVDEQISNFMNSSWPLTRLTLSSRGVTPRTIVAWVEHFKNTLTSLWINSYIPPSEPRSMELSPDLPRLKFLSIHYPYMSVRFFSKLPSLEKLEMFSPVFGQYHAKGWFGDMKTQFSELARYGIYYPN